MSGTAIDRERVRQSAQRTREQWDSFGKEDAEFYIVGHGEHESRTQFLETGKAIVDPVLAYLAPERTGGRLLEIGCGLGRTVHAFAPHFEHVDGADIAQSMVEQARSLNPPENVDFTVISGADLALFADDSFDVVFSFVVFQHVIDPTVISSMIQEIGRVTRSGATAILQFDTRPFPPHHRAIFALPDAVLPRLQRRGIRRNRRSPEWVRAQLAGAGFGIESERARWLEPLPSSGRSAFHHFIGRRI